MSEKKIEEWAIQDEATGEWFGEVEGKGHIFGAPVPHRYSYWDAGLTVYNLAHGFGSRETARIVPAPPQEMSDAECWEWLFYREDGRYALSRLDNDWAIFPYDAIRAESQVGVGKTPYAAIHAARHKLESEK